MEDVLALALLVHTLTLPNQNAVHAQHPVHHALL